MTARYINLVPLLGFAALAGFACYAATVVGHWPYYAFPDPSDLPAGHLSTSFALVLLLSFAVVLLMPIVYLAYRILARVKKWQLPDQRGVYAWYAVGAAPWVLDLVIAWASRYSLISWILD